MIRLRSYCRAQVPYSTAPRCENGFSRRTLGLTAVITELRMGLRQLQDQLSAFSFYLLWIESLNRAVSARSF